MADTPLASYRSVLYSIVALANASMQSLFDTNGLEQTQSMNGTPPPQQATMGQRRTSQQNAMNGHSEGSNSPISRTVTPSMYHIPTFNNHPFDSYSQHSPSLPAMNLRQPSPGRSTSPLNGVNGLEPPQTYEQLIAQNAAYKTRVSELEVINELFRGRVTELEQDASNAKRGVDHLQRQLEESQRRENQLKRRLDDYEEQQADGGDGAPRAKKIRVSDMIGDSESSTPSNA